MAAAGETGSPSQDSPSSSKPPLPRRRRLPSPASFPELVAALAGAKAIVAIVGAGLSTAAGIPDFRSPTSGLYARIAAGEFGELPVSEPQELFDIRVFREEPELFYSVGNVLGTFDGAQPSHAHAFLAALAARRRLLRVYTQNIDGLEAAAGVPASRVVQCHGNMDSAVCAGCGAKGAMADVTAGLAAGKVARCGRCKTGALKPAVVFFHEPLPARFHTCLAADAGRADAVLVMGSSMRVAPVSTLLRAFPASAPAALINRERLTGEDELDVELLGDADLVTGLLGAALQLKLPPPAPAVASHAGRLVRVWPRLGGAKRAAGGEQATPAQAPPKRPAR